MKTLALNVLLSVLALSLAMVSVAACAMLGGWVSTKVSSETAEMVISICLLGMMIVSMVICMAARSRMARHQ